MLSLFLRQPTIGPDQIISINRRCRNNHLNEGQVIISVLTEVENNVNNLQTCNPLPHNAAF